MSLLYVDSGVERSFIIGDIHIRICESHFKTWIHYTKLGHYHIVMVV